MVLPGNAIGDEGANALAGALGQLKQLTEFWIGSGVTDVGMKEFAGILAMGALPKLTKLSISNVSGQLKDACALRNIGLK